VAWNFKDVILFGSGTPSSWTIADLMGNWDNLTSIGILLNLQDSTAGNILPPTSPHVVAHSAVNPGIRLYARFVGATFASITCWRCNGVGFSFGPQTASDFIRDTTINSLTCFGNTTTNFELIAGNFNRVKILGGTIAGDTTFATTNGILPTAGSIGLQYKDFLFENMQWSPTSGIFVPHTNDINFNSLTEKWTILCRNCILGSANIVANAANIFPGSYLASARHQQVSNGSHYYWTPFGLITAETTTYHTASPSEKLAPSSSTFKLESGQKQVALASGVGCTVTVWIRKNTTYNGNAPRLIQKADAAVGLNADSVLATFSAAADTWQQLTGTVAALSDNAAATLVVDCDGTLGAAFVDDWAVS
jgi:hypothetical protein